MPSFRDWNSSCLFVFPQMMRHSEVIPLLAVSLFFDPVAESTTGQLSASHHKLERSD
jgi:hypothetical protein